MPRLIIACSSAVKPNLSTAVAVATIGTQGLSLPNRICESPTSAREPGHVGRVDGARRVVEEPLQLVQHAVGQHLLQLRIAAEVRDAMRDRRDRAAAVAEDEADIGIARERAVDEEAQDRARRVEGELGERGGDLRQDAGAAVGHGRVHEHDRLAPVQFGEHRIERGLARPAVDIAREDADAVGAELRAVLDLGERAVEVRQRDRGEEAEAAGMGALHPGHELVAVAREHAGVGVVAPPDAGRRDRAQGCRDAVLVHRRKRALGRPVEQRRRILAIGQPVARLHLVVGRQDVVMNVDAARIVGHLALPTRS